MVGKYRTSELKPTWLGIEHLPRVFPSVCSWPPLRWWSSLHLWQSRCPESASHRDKLLTSSKLNLEFGFMLITPSMLAPFSAFPFRSPPSPLLTLSNRISCAPSVQQSSRITIRDFSPSGGHWRHSSSHTCSSQHCPPLAWWTMSILL